MQFPCPTCSATLSLPDDSAGRKAQCPSCQTVFRVGEPPTVASQTLTSTQPAAIQSNRKDAVSCPSCDKLLAFNGLSAGQVVICPGCQRRVQMPTAVEMDGGREETNRPQPTIRRNIDPYATPSTTVETYGSEAGVNYAAPGWALVVLSIFSLVYDVIWAGVVALGMMVNKVDADAMIGFAIFFVWALIAIVCHGITLVAGVRMTQRQSLATARLGSIIGLLPCGFCSALQIPIAIWALVILYGNDATRDFTDLSSIER